MAATSPISLASMTSAMMTSATSNWEIQQHVELGDTAAQQTRRAAAELSRPLSGSTTGTVQFPTQARPSDSRTASSKTFVAQPVQRPASHPPSTRTPEISAANLTPSLNSQAWTRILLDRLDIFNRQSHHLMTQIETFQQDFQRTQKKGNGSFANSSGSRTTLASGPHILLPVGRQQQPHRELPGEHRFRRRR